MKGWIIAGLVLGVLLLCGVFPWVGILVASVSIVGLFLAFKQ